MNWTRTWTGTGLVWDNSDKDKEYKGVRALESGQLSALISPGSQIEYRVPAKGQERRAISPSLSFRPNVQPPYPLSLTTY